MAECYSRKILGLARHSTLKNESSDGERFHGDNLQAAEISCHRDWVKACCMVWFEAELTWRWAHEHNTDLGTMGMVRR